ncbi:xylulokinase [Vibrio sp. 99-8-1]|uniref:xylulokinase n=1 Tax=Vibrio sp. 99-8-1 TaxID=2607602 RepID=UPI001493D5B3|nr:xylulokinase [Vibrio sp. 99-8-1]NOI68548.1 xylulokinase [Vibrio sp. 99-8-1]
MYIGIDLGTSGVKVLLLDNEDQIVATHSEPLTVSRPQPLWSEQDASHWWSATDKGVKKLQQQHDLSRVKAIGLSGQMHGATLLDKNGELLRPAILWNDGRSFAECQALEHQVVNSRELTGNIMMPGFTAPKLLWVKNNEPDIFDKVNKVLLPKDYLRYKMSGDFASDMSDSAGTMWLNVAKRDWDDALLSATGLTRKHMPDLFEGDEITGILSEEIAEQWGMSSVPIVAGAGDNAAGAIGVGITQPKQAMLSLGTSGVYFAVSDGFVGNPESALHSFCHALPRTWHAMSVILSAASCLDWVASLTGQPDVGSMLKEVEQSADRESNVIFLPYLSGERTPHNDPNAKGVFFGMTHSTTKLELALAVLEGVGFALADGLDALHATSLVPEEVNLIGGGAKSEFWRQMLADITNMNLVYRVGGEVGPALGAARLARLAVTEGLTVSDCCPIPELKQRHTPNAERAEQYKVKRDKYRSLYLSLSAQF